MIKHIDQISFVLFDTHAQGLRFGQDLTRLEPMPLIEDDTTVDPDYIWSQYDKKIGSIPGRWDNDARICLVAQSPRPACVGALLMAVDASARSG